MIVNGEIVLDAGTMTRCAARPVCCDELLTKPVKRRPANL